MSLFHRLILSLSVFSLSFFLLPFSFFLSLYHSLYLCRSLSLLSAPFFPLFSLLFLSFIPFRAADRSGLRPSIPSKRQVKKVIWWGNRERKKSARKYCTCSLLPPASSVSWQKIICNCSIASGEVETRIFGSHCKVRRMKNSLLWD